MDSWAWILGFKMRVLIGSESYKNYFNGGAEINFLLGNTIAIFAY
jgi:hypothetical protein